MITILAVDDDPNDLFFIKRALSPSELSYRLITASDGIEAQECLQKMAAGNAASPVVVFSDVDMPRQSGLAFLDWIKHNPNYRGIPVVMISSFDNRANVNAAFELGAVACMAKPPSAKAVNGLLKTITRMSSRASSTDATIHNAAT